MKRSDEVRVCVLENSNSNDDSRNYVFLMQTGNIFSVTFDKHSPIGNNVLPILETLWTFVILEYTVEE